MRLSNLLIYLTYPLQAIISRKFYYQHMFTMRGVGIAYLLLFSAALAVPACFKVHEALQSLQRLELSSIVAQIPPSRISPQGVLSPNNPADNQPKVIFNSKQEPVLAYNLNGDPIEGFNGAFPITITANAALLNTMEGPISIPWSSIYGSSGADFAPAEAAMILEKTFNLSHVTIWSVVTIWIFSILAFIVLIAAVVTKVLALLLLKLKLSLSFALRINAFGSSLVGVLLLLQFFFNIAFSYIALCLVPVIYSMSFLNHMRKTLGMSLQDPAVALNKGNPFYHWFDIFSRRRPDGTYDDGPEYEDLSPEAKQERVANLQYNIKQQNNSALDAFKVFANDSSIKSTPFTHTDQDIDLDSLHTSQRRGSSTTKSDANTGPNAGTNSSNNAGLNTSPNDGANTSNNAETGRYPRAESAEQQTIHDAHHEANLGEQPQANPGEPQQANSSQVHRGNKGEDSSFMP